MNTERLRDALEPTELLLRRLVELVPTLAFIGLILLAGTALSLLLARATRWFVRRSGLEALAERASVHDVLQSLGVRHSISTTLGRLALLLGLLLTLFTASETAGLSGVGQALSAVAGFLPRALAALAILIAGVWGAGVVRRLILRVARRDGPLESPELVAELAQYAIIVVSITLAIGQLGLETSLITGLIEILFAAVALGLALAFALGARGTLSNIIARHYAVQLYQRGDRIRLDDERDGVVTGHGPTSVTIRTEHGELVIPYELLLRSPVHIDRTVALADDDA